MSNQLTIESVVQSAKESFQSANTSKLLWEKEAQFAVQLFRANDYLAQCALSNPESARFAITNLAAIGVSLNPSLKHAYLLPKSIKTKNGWVKSVSLDISYIGLLHLATESGSILWGQADVVYKNDTFKLKALGEAPEHDHNPFCTSRGEVIGVYCSVKLHNGDFLTETMSIDEIYDIRARSESYKKGYGPWITDEKQMMKKTPVKRASNYWPKVERLSKAIDYLNVENGEGIEKEPIMRHVSEYEKQEQKNKEKMELESKAGDLVEKMGSCKSFEELKVIFQDAYRLTKDTHLMKNVQIEYEKQKERLNA